MAKSGHKTGKGLLAGNNITAEQLIRGAKEQSSSLRSSGFAASLDLGVDTMQGRMYVWMFIDGNKVKRYIDKRDVRHYRPDQIFYDKPYTKEEARKLSDDYDFTEIKH